MHKFLPLLIPFFLFSSCSFDSDPSSDLSYEDVVEENEVFIWHSVAGSATADFNPDFPFLQFIPTLDLTELKTASQGRELFVGEWVAAPGSRPLLDGLGPLTIAASCGACHLSTGRAASLEEGGDIGVGLLFRLRDSEGNADSYYGGQLQTAATAGSSEGFVTWAFDNDNRPLFTLTTNELPLDSGINLGPRLSPQLTGIGLLDLVSDNEILSREDEYDLDNDGISGRAHWVDVNGELELGRFGWKAMQPTLRHQSAGAMQQDMGLTTTLNPTEPCTELQTICDLQPSGGSPEVSDTSLDAITEFLTLLSVPQRRVSDQDQFNQGSKLFAEIGCAGCHQPTLTTGISDEYPLLSGQLIYAYTDLLLHDLGEDLNDNVKEGDAEPSEWRTPALWSLGLVEAIDGSRFLHDGRAQTIDEAILWHGGEASDSKQNFERMSVENTEILLAFLRSI